MTAPLKWRLRRAYERGKRRRTEEVLMIAGIGFGILVIKVLAESV